MHLRVEGRASGLIRGESNAGAHLGEIEVREWSWGMGGAASLGAGGKATRASLDELRITKLADSASTALMSVMRNNEPIKKAVLSVRKSGTAGSFDFLVVTIERGRLTRFDIGTEAPDSPVLVERLAIAFEKIDVCYHAQDEKGARRAAMNFATEIER